MLLILSLAQTVDSEIDSLTGRWILSLRQTAISETDALLEAGLSEFDTDSDSGNWMHSSVPETEFDLIVKLTSIHFLKLKLSLTGLWCWCWSTFWSWNWIPDLTEADVDSLWGRNWIWLDCDADADSLSEVETEFDSDCDMPTLIHFLWRNWVWLGLHWWFTFWSRNWVSSDCEADVDSLPWRLKPSLIRRCWRWFTH